MREMKDSGVEWIDKIPSSWSIVPLKTMVSFGKGLPITKENLIEKGVAVVSYGQIHSKMNVGSHLNEELVRYVSDEYLQSNRNCLAKKGDILIADTSEDYEGIGNSVLNDWDENLFAGYHTVIIRPSDRTYSKYLAYLFMTDAWRSQLRSRASGIKVFSVTQGLLKKTAIIIPRENSVQKITDYLDAKCSKIDEIIEKQQAIIEKLKEYKLSIITEAVTSGINPDVEMKDSGSVWFGSIPINWQMKRLKYVFHIQKDIAGEEGHTVLSITQRGIIPKDFSNNEGQFANSYANYQLVHKGDFAMNHMDLLTGWVDISKYEGVTSPDYRVFVLNDKNGMCPEYYLYMMQMCYSARIFYGLGQGVSGMGRWRLQADKFLNFHIPIPPYDEQKIIADYITDKVNHIEVEIDKRNKLIEKYQEYKKSLIYEVVTGKKEV